MPNVLRISEAASLALHTTVLLAANSGELLSTREIASTLKMSAAHLSKVLQRLARHGLVESIRGPKGGFSLARSPAKITLLEVYEAIEGRMGDADCLLSERLCDGKNCIMGSLLKDTNRQVRNYLSKTKLSGVTNAYRSVLIDA